MKHILKDILTNILMILLFSILFIGMILLKADKALGLYGLILSIYVFAKMILSIMYKPVIDQPPNLVVDCVIPSYNEDGEGLVKTIESLLVQTYPINKIYVVDDGSPDERGYFKVKEFLESRPDLNELITLYRLPQNLGKRHAQGWAFQQSNADVFFTVDSDSYVYPNALYELMRTFSDNNVYASTGHINARNRDENFLTRLIDIRYDNAFRVERAAQSMTGNILTCSGPLSIYRREVVIPNLDRYLNQTFLGVKVNIGDDRCLTNYANFLGKTKYQSTARCDTDVPTSLKIFTKQQIRWNKSFFRETLIAVKLFFKRPFVALWSSLEFILFVLLTFAYFNLLFNNFEVIKPEYFVIVLSGVILSAFARNIHYAIKHPFLFLLAPFYGILHLLLLQPIRLYALLTIRNAKWGTRTFKKR